MRRSYHKLAMIIIILALMFNLILFISKVTKKSEIVDPPKSEQIIIPEPNIDTVIYDKNEHHNSY
jgi:hypothetical protein